MAFGTFWRHMRPVMSREPAVFVKAMAATCHVEEWNSRALVKLRPAKAEVGACPAQPGTTRPPHQAGCLPWATGTQGAAASRDPAPLTLTQRCHHIGTLARPVWHQSAALGGCRRPGSCRGNSGTAEGKRRLHRWAAAGSRMLYMSCRHRLRHEADRETQKGPARMGVLPCLREQRQGGLCTLSTCSPQAVTPLTCPAPVQDGRPDYPAGQDAAAAAAPAAEGSAHPAPAAPEGLRTSQEASRQPQEGSRQSAEGARPPQTPAAEPKLVKTARTSIKAGPALTMRRAAAGGACGVCQPAQRSQRLPCRAAAAA